MKQPVPPNWSPYIGLIYWGDIGPITTYKSRFGKPVWFSKTYPDKPPSQAQLTERQKMIDAAIAWRQLSQEDRDAYARTTKKLSLCITPFALFFALQHPQNRSYKTTLEHQAKETLK